MEHSTQTATEHILVFTDQEADLLGQWLLDMYDSDSVREAMSDVLQDLVSSLANHLNGVD